MVDIIRDLNAIPTVLPPAYYGPYRILQQSARLCCLPALVDREFVAEPTPNMMFLAIIGGRCRQLSIYLHSDGVREHLSQAMHLLAVHLQDLVALCIGRTPYTQCGPYATVPSRRGDDDSDYDDATRDAKREAKRHASATVTATNPAKHAKTNKGQGSGGSASQGKRKSRLVHPPHMPDASDLGTQLLGLRWLNALLQGVPFMPPTTASRDAAATRAALRSKP